MPEKVVLAYSGGLDTSVAIKWIQENYGLDVVALTIDLGSERDLPSIRQRALDVGAIDAKIVDGRDLFKRAPFTSANTRSQRPLVARSSPNCSWMWLTKSAPKPSRTVARAKATIKCDSMSRSRHSIPI